MNLYDLHVNRLGRIGEALNTAAVTLAGAKSKKESDDARTAAVTAVRAAIRAKFDDLDARTPAAQRRGEG